MRRMLFLIIILTILFTSSCASSQSNSDAASPSTESSQSVLYFGNSNFGSGFDSKTMNQKLHDTICLYASLDERQKESLIDEYLRKMDTYKKTPDSVVYIAEKPLVEYYSGKTKEKMSLVFHLYADNFKSQTENINTSQEAIICTTLNLNDFQRIGYLSYTCDDQKRTNHESLFDTKKNLISIINYQYLGRIPFPFITEYEDMGNHDDIIGNVLNINQKFWIYKDKAEFDSSGTWTGYAADIYGQSPGCNFECSYGHVTDGVDYGNPVNAYLFQDS